MNIERDKFLTEKVYPSWFDGSLASDEIPILNFSTPDGFFKLWEWAQKQGWWIGFCLRMEHIHPDRFADAVYQFLKDNK